MEDKLDVDGVPLDMLLPTPTPRVKRKEPDNILDAEKQMKSGMNTALPPENKGMTHFESFPWPSFDINPGLTCEI